MANKKVIRVLVYDGPAEWVDDTLRASISGILICGKEKSVSAATVFDSSMVEIQTAVRNSVTFEEADSGGE